MFTLLAEPLATDRGRDFHRAGAVKQWSAREVMAANVTFEVSAAIVSDSEIIITTKVDGDYNQINLPAPSFPRSLNHG